MAVLVVLVRRHCCAVGAAVRRAVGDEAPGAVEEDTGQAAALCRVPKASWMRCLYMPLVLGALNTAVVLRDVDPRQVVGDDATDSAHVPRHLRERAHH